VIIEPLGSNYQSLFKTFETPTNVNIE